MIPLPPEVFAPELLPGETVEWSGQPNPRVIFHPEDWGVIPFSLLWGGFAIFWTLGASGMWDIWAKRPDREFSIFGLIWGVPFVLAGQYFIWGRFVHEHWKKRRTYYALTDRRALIVECGLRDRNSSSAYFNNLTIIDKRSRADGIGSIAFGGPVTNKWRLGKNNPPPPPTFDDINDVEYVYRMAIRRRDQAVNAPVSSGRFWSG